MSAILNKALRQVVVPILRDGGFEQVDARNAWSWRKDCVLVLRIQAVGSYIADVTGWPPGSVSVSLGAFYTFMPRRAGQIKLDQNKRLCPTEPDWGRGRCRAHIPGWRQLVALLALP